LATTPTVSEIPDDLLTHPNHRVYSYAQPTNKCTHVSKCLYLPYVVQGGENHGQAECRT
jgi:hypothetical protein